MDDITQKYEFQQILRDAAEYRILRATLDARLAQEVEEITKRLREPNKSRFRTPARRGLIV